LEIISFDTELKRSESVSALESNSCIQSNFPFIMTNRHFRSNQLWQQLNKEYSLKNLENLKGILIIAIHDSKIESLEDNVFIFLLKLMKKPFLTSISNEIVFKKYYKLFSVLIFKHKMQ